MSVDQITTYDIAKRLGVARTTVSNILSPKGASMRYSEKTRVHVLQTAKEMGYHTSLMKRVSIIQPLHHIAFLGSGTASLKSPIMKEILDGVQLAATQENYLIMPSEILSEDKTEDEIEREWSERTEMFIELISGHIIEGLILDSSNFGLAQKAMLEKANVKFVCVNGPLMEEFDESDLDAFPSLRRMYLVNIDHKQGGRLAMEYLLKLGHRRIAIFNTSTRFSPHYAPYLLASRLKGCKEILEKAGIQMDPNLLLELPFNADRAIIFSALDAVLGLSQPPTALFVHDDYVAVLVMNYLREKGLSIPKDISIVGYGNLPICDTAVPKLTTVDVPWATMGKLGAETLISLLNSKKDEYLGKQHFVSVLEPKLVEGESVTTLITKKNDKKGKNS